MTVTGQAPLERKKALILGLGQTGAASARWLSRNGYALRLLDTRNHPPGQDELCAALGTSLESMHFGPEQPPAGFFDGMALVVISPGLVPSEQPVALWLEQARAAGAEIVGEIELFARALAAMRQTDGYQPRLVGITGTNGKTTVTALTRRMLEAAGLSSVAAGNISPAALDALMDAIDQGVLPQVWVLELSSFQLVQTRSLALDAATVLNISQDHLDWHLTMQAYCEAKAGIYAMAANWIINRDDPAVVSMVATPLETRVRSFGAGMPELVNDVGIEVSQGVAWLVEMQSTEFDDLPRARRRKGDPQPVRESGRLVRLMPADALPLVGRHNAMNVLAAASLARSLGVGWAPILKAATDYQGEPHRMRFVRTVQEIDFFNDSKGTNVGAAVAGIEGLGRRVVLIAGGLAKGQDFEPLARILGTKSSVAVLIGTDAPLLEHALRQAGVSCSMATSMEQAVAQAFELARAGDAVVLSPACASFDMFKNYGHRGDVFEQAVLELALNQGEVA